MNDTVITVVGRIVDVPKRRITDAGVSVLNMRVGATARRYDREAQKWVDGDSLYVNVACWRQLADNVARSLVQGDAVVAYGRFFTREYEHNGQRRSAYDMEAYSIGADLTWGRVEYVRTRRDVVTHEVIDADSGDGDGGGVAAGPDNGTGIDTEAPADADPDPDADVREMVAAGR